MHLRNGRGRLWIVIGFLMACATPAAVVYKWTDADGVIHYSDQSTPGAERIVTSSGAANGVGFGGGARTPVDTSSKKPASRTEFTVFAIESPAKEQVFFGDEPVSVRLQLTPALRPNQSLTWHLNGTALNDQEGSVGFTLPSLPRGTYQVSATVTDMESGASQTSDSVTFYVRQPSALAPQHKKT